MERLLWACPLNCVSGIIVLWDSVPVEYDELVEGGLPVPDRTLPLLRCFAQAQVEQLAHRVVVGESAPPLDDFAQAVVQRFDRIGGVDHLADRRRIVEERRQTLPVLPPQRRDSRILLAPGKGKTVIFSCRG